MFRARTAVPVLPLLGAALVLWMSAGTASAQQIAGEVFNQVFNVGGVGARGANTGTGSVGCGGGSGFTLSTTLNTALGQNTIDGGAGTPLAARRDLWRFCDNMTNDTMGANSWTAAVISVSNELNQNTSFAPAELFEQSEMAQSLGRWHGQNIALRIQ